MITRLYEAKKSIISDPEELIQSLVKCDQGGYMDSDIFEIFLSKIKSGQIQTISEKQH